MKVRFPEGNTIIYGQDFSFHTGVPANIDFDLEIKQDGHIILKAPGYGQEGDYGGGCLHLRFLNVTSHEYRKSILEEVTRAVSVALNKYA